MKNKIFKFLVVFLLIATFVTFFVDMADAQCAMCRASAESNLKNGGTEGQGLNRGILYLFAMPYVMVGTLGFLWWRSKKKLEEQPEV
ncbi:MAG: hypothetical protein AAF502_05860 [Bacteroidota bacterium]